eukprot:s82_g12.t1
MFTWSEGQEFHLGDIGTWIGLSLNPGMIIEVLLDTSMTGGVEDLWGGFLVYSVEVLGSGELVVTAKSLGCSDGEVSKTLSGLFNRRVGAIHLCHHALCLEGLSYSMHATRLRTFSAEGFKRGYMTAATNKQLKKWLDEIAAGEGADLPPPLEHPGAPSLGVIDPALDGEALSGDDVPETAVREVEPKRKPARRREGKISGSEREELRNRLEAAKDRMVGEAGRRSAGKAAVRPAGFRPAIEVSSSPEYSPSLGPDLEIKKEKEPTRKRKPRALDPNGPRKALAGVGPELSRGAAEKKKKKTKETLALVPKAPVDTGGTRGSTTNSLQKQLMARAAESAQERRERKAEKKSEKNPGRQLAKILTQVVKGSKSSKKKRRRRRKKELRDQLPGGGPPSSSGDSLTGDSDDSYKTDSGEEGESSSDSAKMQPPLKRKAMQRPGSVLKLLVEHAKEKLDQTSKIAVSRRDEDDLTGGVRITSYFAIVVRPQLNPTSPQLRELHMLAHGLDLLRAGELDSLGDLLASRFISLHQAGLDGNWHAARHLEMIPYDESSAAGASVVLQAKKHARLAAQLAGTDPSLWRGAPKGKGRGKGSWDDSPWQSDNKGKGKKGDKGRGRGKGAWKGSGQVESAGDVKNKEKASAEATSSAFCTSNESAAAETPTLRGSFERCTCFKRIGCELAWWLIAGSRLAGLDGFTTEFWESWQLSRAAKTRSTFIRSRGATFPLREGDLSEFVEEMKRSSLHEATTDVAVRRWCESAWTYLVFVGLNNLAGVTPRPDSGRWSSAEARAAGSIRQGVEIRCRKDSLNIPCTESAWKKDMSSRTIGYGGEEVSVCEKLTLEQILPALPPMGHGASVDALDWVGPRTRYFLLNPKELLKPEEKVCLPRMPGKVHVEGDGELEIAWELVRRNVCSWLPLEKVHSVGNQRVLNGLFGVSKPTFLDDGRRVLRLIMNLTGSNSTQESLVGGCDSLPNITSWQSLVIEDGQTLSCYQSDMAAAFYLFKIPSCWHPHLAFNIVTNGININGDPTQLFALCCNVIPMGWQSSVGVMQEIAENLMKHHAVGAVHQVRRGKTLPPWFSEVLGTAAREHRHWWHVYLNNFAAAERIIPGDQCLGAQMCHQAAEQMWSEAGVISSSKKRVADQTSMIELGAEVDGEQRQLGVTMEKLVKLIQATLWLTGQHFLNRKHVQIIAGRWVFALQFRRPAMSTLNHTWRLIGGNCKITSSLRNAVKQELQSLIFLAPLLFCNLGASISPVIMASDASSSGGAVGIARTLTPAGCDFSAASSMLDREGMESRLPILILSLFDGVGGCFRSYDIAGILPTARIAVEIDEAANRICSRRWPDLEIVRDVHLVDRDMVRGWSRKFLGISEVHVWAGFPCTDLSGVKYNRENLMGKNSKLFYEIPRITKLVEDEFGSGVTVKQVVENVASMDQDAADTISNEMGVYPYLVDPVHAVPMRRPRYCWTTEKLEGVFPDVEIHERKYWYEVIAAADYPTPEQWVDEGFEWQGGASGAATQKRYYLALRKVLPFVEKARNAEDVDSQVFQWVRLMWRQGEPLLTIGDGLSALHFFQPWLKRRLPHSWKLFSTWRKLELPARAPPLTLRLVRGLAAYEAILGHLEMSALLLLGFHCLLRTGEILALTPADLLLGHSSGICSLKSTKSGKRNAATEAISITDQLTLETLRSLVEAKQTLGVMALPLWTGTGAAFRKRFAELSQVTKPTSWRHEKDDGDKMTRRCAAISLGQVVLEEWVLEALEASARESSLRRVASSVRDAIPADRSEVAELPTFCMAMLLICTLTNFIKFHMKLVLENYTTIENLEREEGAKSKFDIGRRRNWEQVFGQNPWMWWIPLHTQASRPIGDGVRWRVHYTRVIDEDEELPADEEGMSQASRLLNQGNAGSANRSTGR